MDKDLPKGAGYRKRLRDRFLQSGLDGFLDYEIIELLLTLGTPRKDCKQEAKAAIKEFNGLRGVLDASLEDLQVIKGIGPSNAFGVKLFQTISERYAMELIPARISLTSTQQVANYLREKLGREKKEHFVSLLLDSQNNLIKIIDISTGTLSETLVHPREVFEPAVRLLAARIMVAHNHPSGDLEASDEDLRLTQRLQSVGELTGIPVIDHFIVSSSGYVSFKEKGLM
ncbi:MAG: DNA repair protein RadC [Gammaproteobacteria bacterium]